MIESDHGSVIVQQIDENYSLCFCGPAAARFADDYNVTRNWGWGLVYMRRINGFPSAYASREIGDRMDDDADDIPTYERLFLVIDDKGPVYLYWQTPMEITRILGADQTLLSFDEAVSKGRNMIVAHWAYELERDPGSYVKIDKVKLGLCRIAKKEAVSIMFRRITSIRTSLPPKNTGTRQTPDGRIFIGMSVRRWNETMALCKATRTGISENTTWL